MVRVPSTEGIVSIRLDDSWIGKQIAESFGPNGYRLRGSADDLHYVRIVICREK